MKRPSIRWALAGTGWMARRAMPDLDLTENARVVAIGSRTQAAADHFAAEHGVPKAFGDFDRMLADEEIDLIYICTTHSSHFSLAERAIRAGKHVLCEKALTVNAAQARRLGQLAEDHGVFLMEAMWMKFNPMIRALQETIASGAIGPVRYIHAGCGFVGPPDPSHRLWSADDGGGALLDLGIYPITFAHLFLGKPDQLTVVGAVREDGLDTKAMLTLSKGDAVAHLAASIEHAIAPSAMIAGETGFITITARTFWACDSFNVSAVGGTPRPSEPTTFVSPIEGFGYVPMFRATSAAVLEGQMQSTTHPLTATVDVLEVIDQARRRLLESHHPDRNRPLSPWEDQSES